MAEFDEVLAHRCSVYGSRSGHQHSAKYEPRMFVLQVSIVGAPELDLGTHRVDLTRLLPVTLEELEEEGCSGEWSTSFKLSGKGKGGMLSVSFGFSVVKEAVAGSAARGGSKRLSLGGLMSENVTAADWPKTLRRSESLRGVNEQVLKANVQFPPRPADPVKELHEVVPSSGPASLAAIIATAASDDEKIKVCKRDMDVPVDELQPHLEAFDVQEESPKLKPTVDVVSHDKGDCNSKEPEVVEFTVIEQGIEIAFEDMKKAPLDDSQVEHYNIDDRLEHNNVEDHVEGHVASQVVANEVAAVECPTIVDQQDDSHSLGKVEHDHVSEEQFLSDGMDMPEVPNLQVEETVMEDTGSDLNSLSIHDSVNAEPKTPEPQNYVEMKSQYKSGRMSKSLSLDDTTEAVASEFLNMLGIEHSPFGLSSDSDPESPRGRLWKQFRRQSLGGADVLSHSGSSHSTSPSERIWKQFEIETLHAGDMESPKERLWREFESETLSNKDSVFFSDIASDKDLDWGEDIDITKIVHAAEAEHERATQAIRSKTRAKLLEDAETETLMREFGLDEKLFQNSPPGSRGGFGSPIALPPEEPLELPPLAEGVGPFIQTKDGGFIRSMNPGLFKNAKNNANLIMQVSSPVVVPAEMGSEIVDILQSLASVGVEKLTMQASKLMPLEDITGKTIQQVAWESTPALQVKERPEEGELGSTGNLPGRKKKGKNKKPSSYRSEDFDSEYVCLEDLAPLAMDKIEALSIEGLRIQSGMSDEDAPSNIYAQSLGGVSTLEGKGAKNASFLGLEGAASLQLVDVKDASGEVDGLMGLSITLDEWMKLDSGAVDEEDLNSERTSKILAAHHAKSADLISGGWKGDKKKGKGSGKGCGLLGNNFTVALMVQLRDPNRNYEPVGTPMLSLIQVERVFVPPKPRIYCTVSDGGNCVKYDDDDDLEAKTTSKQAIEKKLEEEPVPMFKVTEVHVAGLKNEPDKKKVWGNPMQQSSGSRWLLATGMGKTNKNPFMKSKTIGKAPQATTKVQPGETLWSISARVHGNGSKWKELAALNPHIRNPNVIFPNETLRLR